MNFRTNVVLSVVFLALGSFSAVAQEQAPPQGGILAQIKVVSKKVDALVAKNARELAAAEKAIADFKASPPPGDLQAALDRPKKLHKLEDQLAKLRRSAAVLKAMRDALLVISTQPDPNADKTLAVIEEALKEEFPAKDDADLAGPAIPANATPAERELIEVTKSIEKLTEKLEDAERGLKELRSEQIKNDVRLEAINANILPLQESISRTNAALATIDKHIEKAKNGGEVQIDGKLYDAPALQEMKARVLRILTPMAKRFEAEIEGKSTLDELKIQLDEKCKQFASDVNMLKDRLADLRSKELVTRAKATKERAEQQIKDLEAGRKKLERK